MFKISFIIS